MRKGNVYNQNTLAGIISEHEDGYSFVGHIPSF